MFKKIFISKLFQKISIFLSLVFITILILVFISVKAFEKSNIEKNIKSIFNETPEFSADYTSIKPEMFDNFVSNNQWEIVQTKFDFLKPTYSIIIKKDGWNDVYVFHLQRNDIFSAKFNLINTAISVDISNKPFTEAISLAQKYDLSKENPDPQNIRVFEPPSKEQIDRAKAQANASKIPGYTEARRDCILQNTNDPDAEKCMKEVDKKFGVVIPEVR